MNIGSINILLIKCWGPESQLLLCRPRASVHDIICEVKASEEILSWAPSGRELYNFVGKCLLNTPPVLLSTVLGTPGGTGEKDGLG